MNTWKHKVSSTPLKTLDDFNPAGIRLSPVVSKVSSRDQQAWFDFNINSKRLTSITSSNVGGYDFGEIPKKKGGRFKILRRCTTIRFVAGEPDKVNFVYPYPSLIK